MERHSGPVTTSDFVYQTIKKWIVTGELSPGGRIDQNRIATNLNVSKMPVRSAIEKLAVEDWVVIHSHRGVSVAKLSKAHLEDIYLVRCHLEQLAVQLATERLTPKDVGVLTKMIERQQILSEASDANLDELLQANRDFHMYIYQLAGRPILFKTISTLWDQSERYRRILLMERHMVQGSTNDHSELVELMRQNLPEEAGKFIIQHNLKTQTAVVASMNVNAE